MVNLLCEHWELFSETWPTSGSMRSGRVFERPMLERRITDSVCSSLPTPTVDDTFTDKLKSSQQKDGSMHSVTLGQAVQMLPTVVASDHADRRKSENWQGRDLVSTIHEVEDELGTGVGFGKFEAAVRRWEDTLGVKAPAPTQPDGRDGAHRLSSKFTEWMMGLQPAWVTGHGLSRKDELKLCGNGVVPQQARLALEVLIARVSV